MPRYIDADKVEKWSWQEPRYSDSINDRTDLRDFLRSLPTVSPDEVRGVGKWIRHDNYDWDDSFECSCCAEEFVMLDGETPTENGYNYCPSCGARMKGADGSK